MNPITNINFKDESFRMFLIDELAETFGNKVDGNEIIRLTLGNSELPLNQKIIEKMIKALQDHDFRRQVYPVGLPELREKISEYYKEVNHVNINPKNIIVSSGTSMIFRNLFQLFSNENTNVLLPFPYYSVYHFSALLSKTKINFYQVTENGLDIKSFTENYDEKTSIVLINSPGNPYGNILSRKELEEIIRIVDGKALIIFDEIYSNVWFDERPVSLIEYVNKYNNIIITNSFSKGFRMYSRRIGYCVVPNKIVEPLTVIQQHTHLTSDPVSQAGAIAALENKEDVEELRTLYMSRRDYIENKMKKCPNIRVIHSFGGFYITINCRAFMILRSINSSIDLCEDILKVVKVAVVPGSDFGVPDCIRISFTCDRFNEGVDRLVEYFGGIACD